jgi:hypothetical protein
MSTGVPVVQDKWVLRVQRDENCCIEPRKAGFVAKDLEQPLHANYEVIYDYVWAPTAHYSTLRLLYSLAVHLELDIRHIDVKCAFPNGANMYSAASILSDGNPHNIWFLHACLLWFETSWATLAFALI